jgi:hypothetical protein
MIEELLGMYSDLYKELYGTRPRGAYDWLRDMSEAELSAECDKLIDALAEEKKREREEREANRAAPGAGVGWAYHGSKKGLLLK